MKSTSYLSHTKQWVNVNSVARKNQFCDGKAQNYPLPLLYSVLSLSTEHLLLRLIDDFLEHLHRALSVHPTFQSLRYRIVHRAFLIP